MMAAQDNDKDEECELWGALAGLLPEQPQARMRRGRGLRLTRDDVGDGCPGDEGDPTFELTHHLFSNIARTNLGRSTSYFASRYSCDPHSKKLSASPILIKGLMAPAS